MSIRAFIAAMLSYIQEWMRLLYKVRFVFVSMMSIPSTISFCGS